MALTKEDLRRCITPGASTVTSVPGSLSTAIQIATLDAGKLVTAGPASFSDAKAFNCPVLSDLAESDTNGIFIIRPPSGVKHVVIYPFIWKASGVDGAQADFRQWFAHMGYFGSVPQGQTEVPAVLRGEYRGQFRVTASDKTLAATDPIQLKLGGEVAHVDEIVATLDGEAIASPKIIGGVTPNNARHGIVEDVEGNPIIILQGKAVTSGAKIGFEVRCI